uniref:Ionotropic glutamate receptor C-terminal domain-containing protein n=1 Tax=Anopheles arabiensis TaxID=7173 RepID=A0A8W7MUG0_ANOAR
MSYVLVIRWMVLISVPVILCSLNPIPTIDSRVYVQALFELHRQLCPVDKYRNLFVYHLSNDVPSEAVLPTIMSGYVCTKTFTAGRADFDLYGSYYNFYYSCNIIVIDSLEDLKVIACLLEYGQYGHISFQIISPFNSSFKVILIYPKWIQSEKYVSYVQQLNKGYQVVYGPDNTVEIYRWNRYSNQTIALDPHNIVVPDEMRDLHGYQITMYYVDHISLVMTFEKYFIDQVASRRNATAIKTDDLSKSIDVMPVVTIHDMVFTWIIPAFGTTFTAIIVPRAKPKPIVSILFDPFDFYVWITYLMLVLTMAVTISIFGKFLGRRHFMEIVLELIMMCLAGPSRAYGGTFENRIITLFCLMGIVLVSSYQSLVISFMSFVRYGPEINTLEEIYERCLFQDNSVAKLFNFSTHPYGNNPRLNLVCNIVTGRDNEWQTFLMGANFIDDRHAYAKEDYLHFVIENFRVAKKRFFEYPFCLSVDEHLRELFVFYIQAMVESGIYEYYYKNQTRPSIQFEQMKFIDQLVNIEDLLLLWIAYIGGMLLSILCFVMESIVHKENKSPVVPYLMFIYVKHIILLTSFRCIFLY